MASSLPTLNVAALANASTLASGLTNLLLASPQKTQGYQPQNADDVEGFLSLFNPPPGILFHYEGEQTATLSSDITDHFIEDNTALQDQISLKPIVITTHGFIGELNNVPPPILATLQQAANTLTDINSYVPGLSITAQIAYDEAFASYQLATSAANAGVAAWSSLTGGETQNLQQSYFQQFFGYWQTRTLFSIQTPWAIFDSMAILNLRVIQDESTRVITDFEVTFKQIQVAQTSTGFQSIGRALTQSASGINQGTGSLAPGMGVASGLSKMGAL